MPASVAIDAILVERGTRYHEGTLAIPAFVKYGYIVLCVGSARPEPERRPRPLKPLGHRAEIRLKLTVCCCEYFYGYFRYVFEYYSLSLAVSLLIVASSSPPLHRGRPVDVGLFIIRL